MMRKKQATGILGEQIAVAYLKENGYQILDCNYRFGKKEVDCIAMCGEVLVFVEIKTRTSFVHGFPEEAVDTRKKGFLKAAAEGWGDEHTDIAFSYFRFDIVSVLLRDKEVVEIVHIKDAFY